MGERILSMEENGQGYKEPPFEGTGMGMGGNPCGGWIMDPPYKEQREGRVTSLEGKGQGDRKPLFEGTEQGDRGSSTEEVQEV